MSAASDYLELEILDHILGEGNRNYTPATNLYIGLHTADPTDAGSGSEVSNSNAYARVNADVDTSSGAFDAATQPSTGSTYSANTQTITFPTASGGNWGTITHIGIWDSGTYGAGNLLFHGALTASKVVNDGDTFQIQAGNLVISLT